MTILDLIILAVVIVAGITGFMRGIIAQIGQVAALVVAIIACRMFAPEVVDWFSTTFENENYAYAAAYSLVFMVVYISVWLLSQLVRSLIHAVSLGFFDRLGGALFRIVLWTTLLSIALNIAKPFCDESIFSSEERPWRGIVLDFSPTVLGYIEEAI